MGSVARRPTATIRILDLLFVGKDAETGDLLGRRSCSPQGITILQIRSK